MNTLVLAAGRDESVQSSNQRSPILLQELDGEVLVERINKKLSGLRVDNHLQTIYAVNQSDVRDFAIDRSIELVDPASKCILVREGTQGAACTALLAAEYIDSNDELIILNGNEILDIEFVEIVNFFRKELVDAGVVIFDAIHPRYSYVSLDENNLVQEAAEKLPLSRNAVAGFYYFSKGHDFILGAKDLIRDAASHQKKFYVTPTLNYLILNGKRVGVYKIDSKHYHPLKSLEQLQKYDFLAERGNH